MKLFSKSNGTRIFEGLASAEANFKFVAKHVRHRQPGKCYILQDSQRLPLIVEKWRFEPKPDPLSRCGYDYEVVVTNGEVTMTVSICFVCNTLVLDHKEKYAITKRQILSLFSEDFELLK